jgi:3-isopropylmalate/(R)-2-methylmalate dehydratase large subunit
MSSGTLYDKVWDLHRVTTLPSGQDQLLIGLHMVHEVTSPQAFADLRNKGLSVAFPERTVATVDHIVPTDGAARPYADPLAEEMIQHLEQNTSTSGITFHGVGSGRQGIVHVVAPEQGLTQPGMTVACGDSHTATHGAFGAIAFGIGTSQVRDVLATGTLAMNRLKVRQIRVDGELAPGVTGKDIILYILSQLGVAAGVGYAYEFAGSAIHALSMEGRMTICNMAIEGGARVGYVNPDQTTFDYLQGRPAAPQAENWEAATSWWQSLASDSDAVYDDVVVFPASDIPPMVTWGITPGQGIGVDGTVPTTATAANPEEAALLAEAYSYMGLEPGQAIQGLPIDVAFIGSCTNSRIEDLRAATAVIRTHGGTVAENVRALVVPGSEPVRAAAEAEGLDKIFLAAGFQWREAGCSMCLAMNPDKLQGREVAASSSNRNFKGRQGSPTGRTLLMSPAMVALAALNGAVSDVRQSEGVGA